MQYNLVINFPTFRNLSPTLTEETVCHILEDGNVYGPRYVYHQFHIKLRTNIGSVLRTCITLSLLSSHGPQNRFGSQNWHKNVSVLCHVRPGPGTYPVL
jgi:hypothetical protein